MLSSVEILWQRRGRLFAVAAPPMIVAWVVQYALRVALAGVLIDGEPAPLHPVVPVLIWCPAVLISLTAVIPVAAAGLYSTEISTSRALRYAAHRLPAAVGWLLAIGSGVLAAASCGIVLAFCAPFGLGYLMMLGASVALLALLIRPLLVLPISLLEHGSGGPLWKRSMAITHGRSVQPAVAFGLALLAGVAGSVLAIYAAGSALDAVPERWRAVGGAATVVIGLVGGTVTTMAVGTVLARASLDAREPDDNRTVIDRALVEQTLAAIGGAPTRLAPRLMLAAMLAPLLLAPLVPVVNPLGVPDMRSQPLDSTPLAVGFGPSGKPIIVTAESGLRCADAACTRTGLIPHDHRYAAAGLRPDGSYLAVTEPETGHSITSLEFSDCAVDGACSHRLIGFEPGGKANTLAITPVPTGGLLIAGFFAMVSVGYPTQAHLQVWRCDAAYACRSVTLPESTKYYDYADSLIATIDDLQRPVVVSIANGRGEHGARLLRCETAACATMTEELITTPEGASVIGMSINGAARPHLLLRRPAVSTCFEWCFLDLGLVLSRPHFFVADCANTACSVLENERQVYQLSVSDYEGQLLLAAGPDGEPLISHDATQDRILLTCQAHC